MLDYGRFISIRNLLSCRTTIDFDTKSDITSSHLIGQLLPFTFIWTGSQKWKRQVKVKPTGLDPQPGKFNALVDMFNKNKSALEFLTTQTQLDTMPPKHTATESYGQFRRAQDTWDDEDEHTTEHSAKRICRSHDHGSTRSMTSTHIKKEESPDVKVEATESGDEDSRPQSSHHSASRQPGRGPRRQIEDEEPTQGSASNGIARGTPKWNVSVELTTRLGPDSNTNREALPDHGSDSVISFDLYWTREYEDVYNIVGRQRMTRSFRRSQTVSVDSNADH
jgi:hypothetical protein